MIYSIRSDDLTKLFDLEEQMISNIMQCYNEYMEELNNWILEINSQFFFDVAKLTTNMINENLEEGYKSSVKKFDEIPISCMNISKRLCVGDEALSKVKTVNNKFEEIIFSGIKVISFDYSCTGEVTYSRDSIGKYKNISEIFLSKLQDNYDNDRNQILQLEEVYILASSLHYFLEMQYASLINTIKFCDKIYYRFLEWYDKKVQENLASADNALLEAYKNIDNTNLEEISAILAQIMSEGNSKISISHSNESDSYGAKPIDKKDTNQNCDGNEDAEKEERKKALNQMLKDNIIELSKELDTPEKIQKFKNYISECADNLEECKKSTKTEKIGKVAEKLRAFGGFLKKGFSKYGKPITKALSIVVPIFAPQAELLSKVATALPSILECFEGKITDKEDLEKVGLGVECVKALGVEKFPDNPQLLEKYITENVENISNNIIQMIIKNEVYMKILNIDGSTLNDSELFKATRRQNGEAIQEYPPKFNAYDGYDFTAYKPELLDKLSPAIDHDEIKRVENVISNNEKCNGAGIDVEKIWNDMGLVEKQFSNKEGYITLPQNSDIEKMILELKQVAEKENLPKVLSNIDGRYNKKEIEELFSGMKNTRLSNGKMNLEKGVNNFFRKQLGYPKLSPFGDMIVDDLKDLIPIVDNKEHKFIVENEDIKRVVIEAKKMIGRKDAQIAKIGVKDMLLSAGTVGVAIGTVALLVISGMWPIALIAMLGGGGSTGNQEKDAYAKLIASIGEKRAEYLLDNYNNNENVFSIDR